MNETQMRRCIERKRGGDPLSGEEWTSIVAAFMTGGVDEAQMAALFMACVWRGMTFDEAYAITDAMVRSGATLSFNGVPHVVDKHSTGGVSDIVSLVVVPLAAACGARVAKLSGRALGHTGGTIDKLEAIPGFNATLTLDAFVRQVKTVGCAIAAQTEAIVPADKRIYHLRDRTGTVPAIGLIAASVVSKKIACGAPAIVFDVKTGAASYTPEPDRARELAQWLVEICARFGRKAFAFVTDMNQPLGRSIGTGIELIEARDILSGQAAKRRSPERLKGDEGGAEASRGVQLILQIAAQMLDAAGIGGGEDRARTALEDGSAYEKFVEMIEAQGGSRSALEAMALDPEPLMVGSPRSGFVASMQVVHLGNAGRDLSEHDSLGGLRLAVQIGDRVEAGEPLAFAYGKHKAHAAKLAHWFTLEDDPVEPPPLIYDRSMSEIK